MATTTPEEIRAALVALLAAVSGFRQSKSMTGVAAVPSSALDRSFCVIPKGGQNLQQTRNADGEEARVRWTFYVELGHKVPQTASEASWGQPLADNLLTIRTIADQAVIAKCPAFWYDSDSLELIGDGTYIKQTLVFRFEGQMSLAVP